MPGAVLTREVAGVASELGAALAAWSGAMPQRDPLLGSGVHAAGVPPPDSAYHYPYGLFEEALDKDAHLHALIGQRKAAVLAWERSLTAGNASAEAQLALELVRRGLENIGVGEAAAGSGQPGHGFTAGHALLPSAGFDRDLWELLDALPYGLAVSEVVWEWVEINNQSAVISAQGAKRKTDVRASNQHAAPGAGNHAPPAALITDHCSLLTGSGQGPALPPGRYLLPKALLSRHPRRFVFTPAGELRLLTAAAPVEGEPLPPRKFIVFAPYGRHENPYGTPLLRSVWWYSWFKRQALRYWLLHCEKYGMPTAVLTHPPEATERERQAFRRVVGSIQQETGLVVPEGVGLSLLEASRSGGPAAYQALIELCNAEMSKALLGQTLTVDTPAGGGHGSYAMARVHEQVRQDITRLDAQALMGCLNGTLVRWIVELNSPAGRRDTAGEAQRVPLGSAPAWLLTPPRQDDLRLQLEIDRFFAEQGLAVDSSELYARYGRKAIHR
jgi:hypothetical protein